MNVLVVGSGGREHALVWKLSQSRNIDSIFCIPGNGGISEIADCVEINTSDTQSLIAFARKEKIELVVVGPEDPLAVGIVDDFEEVGIPIFGPRKKGAMIETSKVFAKELMEKYSIPTASFKVFSVYDEARAYMLTLDTPFVIKADGLCGGKGAYVIRQRKDGDAVLRRLMVELVHGDAGKRVVIESFIEGVEASYMVFTDGKTILPMIAAQDHKPLLDNDAGPNTGGMGAYAPIPFIDSSMGAVIDRTIMENTIESLSEENIAYKGVLYGGLMLSPEGPYVIEFNARLGDPETQPILFKMESDILPILSACAEGNLGNIPDIQWRGGISICVVIASRGYPDRPARGKAIKGLEELKSRKDVVVFHAATKKVGKEFVTSGGRVLGITGIGETYADAIEKVYRAIGCIDFDGMYFRTDIARKALNAEAHRR
jgi:phosphoribosylamine---glycine ligase